VSRSSIAGAESWSCCPTPGLGAAVAPRAPLPACPRLPVECSKIESATIRPPDSVGLRPFSPGRSQLLGIAVAEASPSSRRPSGSSGWLGGRHGRAACGSLTLRQNHPTCLPVDARSIADSVLPYSGTVAPTPALGQNRAMVGTKPARRPRRARHTRRRGPGCDVAGGRSM
jgi:hypothetical protein